MIQFGTLVLTSLLLQAPSLDSPTPKERLEAVERMSIVGRTENVAPLAAALTKEPKSDVRAAIVAGLGRIGGREVIPVLTQSLQTDLDKDVRLQVVDSFQRLYIPLDTKGPITTIFNKVKSAFAAPDRPVVHDNAVIDPAVTGALADAMQKDFSQEVRAACARALGSLKARDKTTILMVTMEAPQNREHPEVRAQIAESLGLIRDLSAGPALQRAVGDSDRKTSQAAILSLGMIGYKEARPTLENTYRTSGSSEARKKSLEALALMRDPATKPLFESLLDSPDDHTREIAAEGLGRIGYDPKALKTRFDTEQKPNVHLALAFALVAADQDQYFNDLAYALNSRQASQAEVYIYELGKFEHKLPELHRYLKASDARVRARMAHIVGDIGDPSSRPLIQELTSDKDSEVASEALMALRKLTPA